MECSTAKCYGSDLDSHHSPHGHLPNQSNVFISENGRKLKPSDYATLTFSLNRLWEIGESEDRGFESGDGSSQTNDFKSDTCCFPSLVLSIIRIGKGLSGRTMWLSGISCYSAGGLVSHWGSTIKSLSALFHNTVPVLIWPQMLLGRKTPINKQTKSTWDYYQDQFCDKGRPISPHPPFQQVCHLEKDNQLCLLTNAYHASLT